jgi:hypothetical protein
MATKEKKLSPIWRWFLPVLFFLAAFPAFANIPRLAESRVWLPRDFAPLSIRAEREFSPETQGVFEGFNCELTLEPSIDPDGRLGKGFYAGLTSGSSPAGSSGSFDAAYMLGGVLGGFYEGEGQGAKNIGIGAWDAAKGTVQAGWAFTGGTAVNLWEGNQTIYGAIGNNAYNFATSSDARANTWNGVSTYVSETFTDTDKFSQRVGGNGLFTLLTLGAGEVAQGLRAGGATAEGAEALSGLQDVRALKLPTTDPALTGTGTLGYTTPTGDVFLQPGLTRAEQASTLAHESVHAALTPTSGPLVGARQWLGQFGYNNSAFLQGTEEIMAETYASGSLRQGISHAFNGAYSTPFYSVNPFSYVAEPALVGYGVYSAGTAIGGNGGHR